MGLSDQRLLKPLAIVAGALLLAWLAVVTGIAGIARAGSPVTALRWAPHDARALETLADRSLTANPTRQQIADSVTLARRAIARDATRAGALRVIAFATPGQGQAAMFVQADKLSRRDLAAQLWLIDHAVARNDAKGALRHFDAALRTSSAAPQILFPILSNATGDKALLPDITAVLARRPAWASAFLYEALNTAPSAENLVTLFAALDTSGFDLDPKLDQNLVNRTVRDRSYDLARRAYAMAGGSNKALGRAVTNGGFTAPPGVMPFDWALGDAAGLIADRVPMGDGQSRFVVRAEDSGGGIAVRQMLLLAPGSYRLTSKAGDVPPSGTGTVSWSVSCAPDYFPKLLDVNLPATSGVFTVPANCPAQWIALSARNAVDGGAFESWVDDVSIARVTR